MGDDVRRATEFSFTLAHLQGARRLAAQRASQKRAKSFLAVCERIRKSKFAHRLHSDAKWRQHFSYFAKSPLSFASNDASRELLHAANIHTTHQFL